jgi:carboxypeptidase C (cathepsin A)
MRPLTALLLLPALMLAAEPPKPVKTHHAVTIAGTRIDYEATAGTIALKDDDGKPQANIFYMSYVRPGQTAADRPLLFVFNGGPGSSSVWLHLGAFGPKRVAMTDAGDPLPPPANLIDNEGSLLDLADLVFIDPVSTGFSRAVDEKNAKNYHGIQEDATAIAEFIRLYCTQNKRWESPKYIAGESYGTTRAATLAGHLQTRTGLRLNGVILVSAVLNFGTVRPDDGNDLPHVCFLPTYAATAWHHKKFTGAATDDMKRPLAAALKEVEDFANGEYAAALHKGLALADTDRSVIADKVARYCGVSKEFVLRNDLRIEPSRFRKELLRTEGKIVGRYDSRYAAKDGNDAAEHPDFDPSYAAVQGSYTEAFNRYIRGTLNYETDQPYEILTGRVHPWNYGQQGNGRYVNVVPALRTALQQNPSLRVFVANGLMDLATPYAATHHTFHHLGSDKDLLKRVSMSYYEAGHMMYLHKPSLLKLRKDLEAFLTAK